MMKIVVVSDTHMPTVAKKLPTKLIQDLKQADLIIHAGDWQTMAVYEQLSEFADVVGVTGNVDYPDIRGHFRKKEIVTVKGFKLGITHGDGYETTTEERALAMFANDHVDWIIFGHSHIPLLKRVDKVMLFNPGSATDKRRQPTYSYGILTVGKEIEAEHVFYENKN